METTSAKVNKLECMQDLNTLIEFMDLVSKFIESDEDMKRIGEEGSRFLKIMADKSYKWLVRYTAIFKQIDVNSEFSILTNKLNEDRIEIMRNVDDTREFFAQNYNLCTYLN